VVVVVVRLIRGIRRHGHKYPVEEEEEEEVVEVDPVRRSR